MVSWKFYLGRKRITLAEFCSANDIKSHEELVEVLRHAGAEAPTLEETQFLFVKPEPLKETTVEQPAKSTKGKQNVE